MRQVSALLAPGWGPGGSARSWAPSRPGCLLPPKSFQSGRARPGHLSHAQRSPSYVPVPSVHLSGPGRVPISVPAPSSWPVTAISVSLQRDPADVFLHHFSHSTEPLASSALGVLSASLTRESESVRSPFSSYFLLSGSSPEGNKFLRDQNFKIYMNDVSGREECRLRLLHETRIAFVKLFFQIKCGCTKMC